MAAENRAYSRHFSDLEMGTDVDSMGFQSLKTAVETVGYTGKVFIGMDVAAPRTTDDLNLNGESLISLDATNDGDEGGYKKYALIIQNEESVDLLRTAIEVAGYTGKVVIGMDKTDELNIGGEVAPNHCPECTHPEFEKGLSLLLNTVESLQNSESNKPFFYSASLLRLAGKSFEMVGGPIGTAGEYIRKCGEWLESSVFSQYSVNSVQPAPAANASILAGD